MKQIRNCPVCGKEKKNILKNICMQIPKEYHLPDAYDVVACEACGMVYADTDASMDDYDWYYTHCNFYGDDSKDDNSLRYEMVRDFLESYCSKDSIMLDIGAGNGRFEFALQKNGYEGIAGMDPSQESVERLKERGIEAYIGSIYSEVSAENENKYDAIFLFEVAEHLLCPGIGIENVRRMLKENGHFIVSVPDYSMIADDSSDIANYFNLEHINYFSEDSMKNLMRLHGMELVAQKHVDKDLIQCFRRTSVLNELEKDTKTSVAVEVFFEAKRGKEERIQSLIAGLKESQKEVVVWGTGSYVMSLIATTELLDCNIQGFVDNNKIKQGRQMYDYKIYSPEFIRDKKYTILICSMLNGEKIRGQIEAMNTANQCVIL